MPDPAYRQRQFDRSLWAWVALVLALHAWLGALWPGRAGLRGLGESPVALQAHGRGTVWVLPAPAAESAAAAAAAAAATLGAADATRTKGASISPNWVPASPGQPATPEAPATLTPRTARPATVMPPRHAALSATPNPAQLAPLMPGPSAASLPDSAPAELAAEASRRAAADESIASAAPAEDADESSRDAMAGVAPPVYPTQIPAPARLRYALHYHGRSGEAELTWHRDGQRYRLQLRGLGVATDQTPYKPLVEQSSEGAFDAAGLAPDRFTDRRRGRGSGAANFRRDTGRITFSGPANSHPAWPGAQDRLSWLAQVTAISAAAANSGPPLGEISIFVAGARGGADLWRFVWQGAHTADTPLGLLPAQHWRREALQPDSQQVDLWLDPARGHWPVLLRYTALRTGARFELQLAAEPGPAP